MTIGRRIFLDRTDRLQRLAVPSQELTRIAERLRRRGVEILDLSRVANYDGAESSELPAGLKQNASDWRPAGKGQLAGLREAAAHWYDHRFGVTLDPDTEIAIVPNAVIGLTFLAMAFVEAGDMVPLPDPGAPFYRGCVVLCGGGAVPYHLAESTGFRPRFASLAERLVGRTRMLVLAYPHNPTTALADDAFFQESVSFARKHETLVVSDAAFTFAQSGTTKPPSFLSASFATGVGVEIAALDTNFGIHGLSMALICGNREAVSAVNFLAEAGHWCPAQGMAAAAISLLLDGERFLADRVQRLGESRRLLTDAVSQIGWAPQSSPTTPFLWVSVPARVGSEAFCRRMLRRTGILMAPGADFGEGGEGFVRLTIPEDVTKTQVTCERLQRHAKLYQRRLPRPRSPLRERLAPHAPDHKPESE